MQSTNINLSFKTTVGLLFILLIFVLIFMKSSVFDLIVSFSGTEQIAESQKSSKELADLLLSLDKINLDTNTLNSFYIQTLSPLPSYPVDARTLSNFGKANPFVGSFTVIPASASTTVGGVIYSNQREVNNGRSVTPVSGNRR